MANTSSDLPPEIIETILSRLPVKPLLRFKSVSQSWNSIISHPLFVKLHHQQSKSPNSPDLFICSTPSSGFKPGPLTLVKLEDRKLETVKLLETPYDCKHVLCRYGGVFLLTDREKIQVLWSPATRTRKRIWIPFQRRFDSRYGLCPDPASDSFKVVVVNPKNYSVYSVENNSLIIKKNKFTGLYYHYSRLRDYTPVCVDGAVYWALANENIIYFDPRDDKFKVLHKPVEDGKYIHLSDLGGYLCLRCPDWEDKPTITIWVKEKGIDNHSWKDLITIKNMDDAYYAEPQYLVGNKILFRKESSLIVYDMLEKTFEQSRDIEVSYDPLVAPYIDGQIIPRRKSKRKRL